jgi:hypothetical protein
MEDNITNLPQHSGDVETPDPYRLGGGPGGWPKAAYILFSQFPVTGFSDSTIDHPRKFRDGGQVPDRSRVASALPRLVRTGRARADRSLHSVGANTMTRIPLVG